MLSNQTARIIDAAFDPASDIVLIIPSVVFIELFDKYFDNEEFANKIYYEVLTPILECEKIEIRPIDRDTLYALAIVKDGLAGHDMHDKMVLSVAVALECPLITFDPRLMTYVRKHGVIPGVYC